MDQHEKEVMQDLINFFGQPPQKVAEADLTCEAITGVRALGARTRQADPPAVRICPQSKCNVYKTRLKRHLSDLARQYHLQYSGPTLYSDPNKLKAAVIRYANAAQTNPSTAQQLKLIALSHITASLFQICEQVKDIFTCQRATRDHFTSIPEDLYAIHTMLLTLYQNDQSFLALLPDTIHQYHTAFLPNTFTRT